MLSEAILREKKVLFGVSFEVVAPRCCIDNEVFSAEVLMHSYLWLALFYFFPPITELDRVNDGKHLVVLVRHHEGTHTFD